MQLIGIVAIAPLLVVVVVEAKAAGICASVKRCFDPPVSASDMVGLRACFDDKLAAGCYTTAAEPFYACFCACGECSRPPSEDCAVTCETVTTTAAIKTTTNLYPRGGRIFAIGGTTNGRSLKSVEVYDLATGVWTLVADLPTAISRLGAAAFKGRVYVMGGVDSDGVSASTFIYDPMTNAWSKGTSMTQKRYRHGVAVLEERIYAIGGSDGGGGGGSYLSSGEWFSSAANATWTTIPAMRVGRTSTAVAALSDYVYTIGGDNGGNILNTVEAFNPKTNRWSLTAPMGTARGMHTAVSVDGKVYAIGGFASNSGVRLATAEVFDEKSAAWSSISSMSKARSYAGAVAHNGLIYVVGGSGESPGLWLDTVEVYDPMRDAWRFLPGRLRTPRADLGVALLLDDQ